MVVFSNWAKYSFIFPSTNFRTYLTCFVWSKFCLSLSWSCYALLIFPSLLSCSILNFLISAWAAIFAFSISIRAGDIFTISLGSFYRDRSPQISLSTMCSVISLFAPTFSWKPLLPVLTFFLLLSCHPFAIYSINQVSVPLRSFLCWSSSFPLRSRAFTNGSLNRII